MSDQALEAEIQAKGLNAPRITPDVIEASIESEQYHRFPGTNVTIACLTMTNGFNAIGSSSCVSDLNFDKEIGKKIARENALDDIWKVKGYELCQQLHEANSPEQGKLPA